MFHRNASRVKTKLRVNDTVRVICGKDKGKEGKILNIDTYRNVTTISGVNMVKKAMRRRHQEDKGGIIDLERPVNLSNVQIVSKGKVSRLRYHVAPDQGGNKRRKAIKTGEML